MQALYCHTGGTTCLFWPVEKMGRFIKAKKVIYTALMTSMTKTKPHSWNIQPTHKNVFAPTISPYNGMEQ